MKKCTTKTIAGSMFFNLCFTTLRTIHNPHFHLRNRVRNCDERVDVGGEFQSSSSLRTISKCTGVSKPNRHFEG